MCSSDLLTAIAHQVSTDNVHYQSVTPDQVLAVPYWYRAVLTRIDANFDQAAAPLDMPGTDPSLNPAYTLQSTATTDLGGGIIRTHVELLGHLRPGSARGDASRRHAGGVRRHRAFGGIKNARQLSKFTAQHLVAMYPVAFFSCACRGVHHGSTT